MELEAAAAHDKYWRIQVLKPKLVPASWEEKAFAEDTSRALGGCIWPPRCYSCSFCRREFKSAQALGGHMNVHRRDRARLKQSLIGSASDHENDCKSLLGSGTNHHHHHQLIVSSSHSVITTASAVSTNSRVSEASYNYDQEQSNNYSISPKLLGVRVDLKSNQVEKKHKGSSDSIVGTDLCAGMNSNINEARSSGKRAKISTGVSSFSSFLVKELSSSSSCADEEIGLLNSGSNIADLDLELRLGNRPVPTLSWD